MNTQERAKVAIQVWQIPAEFLLVQGRSVFFFHLGLQLIEGHHSMEDIVLHSKVTDLSVNLVQKRKKERNPYRNIQNNVWPYICVLWPSKVDT